MISDMNYININPGLKTGLKKAFTITMGGRVFFLTHNEYNNTIEWNMFVEEDVREKVEKVLINYLTNQ